MVTHVLYTCTGLCFCATPAQKPLTARGKELSIGREGETIDCRLLARRVRGREKGRKERRERGRGVGGRNRTGGEEGENRSMCVWIGISMKRGKGHKIKRGPHQSPPSSPLTFPPSISLMQCPLWTSQSLQVWSLDPVAR